MSSWETLYFAYLTSFFKLVLHAIYGPLCKHLLFLSEFTIISNFGDIFKQYKPINQQINTNLLYIKGRKQERIKKNQKRF